MTDFRPHLKAYDITYLDRRGNPYNMQLLAYDVKHALHSAVELTPLQCRVTKVNLHPEWS